MEKNRNNKKPNITANSINKFQDTIERQDKKISKELYGDIPKNLDDLKNSLNQNINIVKNNYNGKQNANVLEFLTKVRGENQFDIPVDSKGSVNKNSMSDILSRSNAMSLLTAEEDRINRYEDYKIIVSYIPEVKRCIEILKDCVLSADDITKDSLYVFFNNVSIYDTKNKQIQSNVDNIIKKFKLNLLKEDIVRDTLILGEQFVCVLKLEEELNNMVIHESDELFNKKKLNEAIDITDTELTALCEGTEEDKDELKDCLKEAMSNINVGSPSEMLIEGDKEFILKNLKNSKVSNNDIKINGSILKLLDPNNIVKLEMDNICYGYVYFKINNIENGMGKTFNSPTANALNADFFNVTSDLNNGNGKMDKVELISNVFIRNITKKLDKKFIEKNKEFKDYIYELVKNKYIFNNQISLVYLKNEDIVHFKLGNKEYGESRLAGIVFFAKLYLASLITSLMEKISRSRDKRITFVDVGLDEDAEGVVQETIRDLKSKEINIGHLKTISTVLNRIGVFEDFYMPVIDGTEPIKFDTIQGSDVQVDNDFLAYLLKSIVNGLGIPANYLDVENDVDFARTLSMQNSTFVRKIISDQGIFSEYFSQLFRKLYAYEYPEECEGINLDDLEIKLPTPNYLNIINVNEQISNTSQLIDFVTNVYIADDAETGEGSKKSLFRKEVTKELLPNLDWNKFDDIYNRSVLDEKELALEKKAMTKPDDDTSGGGDFDDF